MASDAIWTIGHSNNSFEHFAGLAVREGVQFAVDVRSYPYSRFAPHFNREELEARLAEQGIRYVYLGDELGGRPSQPGHYDEAGRALYAPMSREPAFRHAIDRLVAGARDHRMALVCSEGSPEECHRRLLVGKVLTTRGIELRHILPDGSRWDEDVVLVSASRQDTLFDQDEHSWTSTRSVSRRRRLSTSSVD